MSDAKPTAGNWKAVIAVSPADGSYQLSANGLEIGILLPPVMGPTPEFAANAALIAEAGTVYHETGMTPRQWVNAHETVSRSLDREKKLTADIDAEYGKLLAALTLAEDVLSRFPYSSEIWPGGIHPNTGITQIRTAIAKAK